MGKRFTDTKKWNDGWFLQLKPGEKLAWLFLLDTCSPAGRWKKNLKLLNFCCDTNMSEKDFVKTFDGRVVDCGDFYFIPKFLTYQYPRGLDSNKPAVVAVRKELEKYKLLNDALTIKQSLPNDCEMVKEKEKEKEKDHIGGIVKGGGKFVPPTLKEVEDYCALRRNSVDPKRFVDYYESKGWFVGKTKMKKWQAAVRLWETNNKRYSSDTMRSENVYGGRSEDEKRDQAAYEAKVSRLKAEGKYVPPKRTSINNIILDEFNRLKTEEK